MFHTTVVAGERFLFRSRLWIHLDLFNMRLVGLHWLWKMDW